MIVVFDGCEKHFGMDVGEFENFLWISTQVFFFRLRCCVVHVRLFLFHSLLFYSSSWPFPFQRVSSTQHINVSFLVCFSPSFIHQSHLFFFSPFQFGFYSPPNGSFRSSTHQKPFLSLCHRFWKSAPPKPNETNPNFTLSTIPSLSVPSKHQTNLNQRKKKLLENAKAKNPCHVKLIHTVTIKISSYNNNKLSLLV